jgi:hypothetical protein
MNRFVTFIFIFLLSSWPVMAQGVPGYSASPSATLGTSPSVTPGPTVAAGEEVACSQLMVVSGNDSLVPAEVRFRVDAAGDGSLIKRYRFHYGDGVVEDRQEREVTHRYTRAGTFEAFVEVETVSAKFVTSERCRAQVSVKNPPLVQARTECAEVVVEGNDQVAPAKVIFRINGFSSAGDISRYKLDIEEIPGEIMRNNNVFEWTFDKPGTYRAKGYVLDPESQEYVGGANLCNKQVRVLGGALETQPETGVPFIYWVIIWGVLVVGLMARKLAIGNLEDKFGDLS